MASFLSDAEDSDEFNTTSARIYFGPILSPEKRAAARPLEEWASTTIDHESFPVMRLTKDGTAPADRDTKQEPEPSRPETPENGLIQDEPSSVLASRVIRAHGGPSPPPWLRETPSTLANTFIPHQLPSNSYLHPELPLKDVKQVIDVVVPLAQPSPLIPQTEEAYLLEIPASCDSPEPPQGNIPFKPTEEASIEGLLTTVEHPTSPPHTESPYQSVPLLDLNPPLNEPQTLVSLSGTLRIERPPSQGPSNEELQEEHAVADALSYNIIHAPRSSPLEGPSIHVQTYSPLSSPSPSPNPQTPPRRSSRSRNTGTPHPTPTLLDAPFDEGALRSSSPQRLLAIDASTRIRKRKGKERAASPGNFSMWGATVPLETNANPVVAATGSRPSGVGVKSPSRRRASASPDRSRQVGSLSPTSVTVLSQLLPTPSQDEATYPIIPSSQSNVDQRPDLTPPSETTTTKNLPQRVLVPVSPWDTSRTAGLFASPKRPISLSPARNRMGPVDLDDPNRSPARRVPIEQAIAKGYITPLKAASRVATSTPFSAFKTSSQNSSSLIATRGTPNISSRLQQSIRNTSPIRNLVSSTVSARSQSVEPSTSGVRDVKQSFFARSRSVDPPPSTSATSSAASRSGAQSTPTLKAKQLPYPLHSSSRAPPETIAEADEGDATHVKSSSNFTPSKVLSSPLKTSTLKQPTSRIPRIGSKPYARPTPVKRVESKKLEQKETSITTTASTGDQSRRCIENGVQTITRTTFVSSLPAPSSRLQTNTASTLKRKRELGNSSNDQPRPVIARSSPGPSSSLKVTEVSHVPPVSSPPPDLVGSSIAHETLLNAAPSTADNKVVAATINQLPVATPEETLANTTTSRVDDAASTTRRTTRPRRPVASSSTSRLNTTASVPVRRNKTPALSVLDRAGFSGLTAVALKALTSSNTVRNQVYLAATLETEVIRKEGARPESPAVKVRTVTQREQEERGKERKERAERRARRQPSSSDAEANSDHAGSSNVDGDSDWEDSDLFSSPLRRHQRGPGDEEDYETPDRPDRPLKRLKAESGVENGVKRQVKWDRGLFTTVYLDELKPGTRPPPKENVVVKGCLAPTAKAIQLDTLGNLPNAGAPFTDLVQENIVVKKFVYDNEVEVVPEPIVKNTRSRSKKGKS